jgi:hypothetical protein
VTAWQTPPPVQDSAIVSNNLRDLSASPNFSASCIAFCMACSPRMVGVEILYHFVTEILRFFYREKRKNK